jgi:hypothetical protein
VPAPRVEARRSGQLAALRVGVPEQRRGAMPPGLYTREHCYSSLPFGRQPGVLGVGERGAEVRAVAEVDAEAPAACGHRAVREPRLVVHLGFGRTVASAIEVPIILANMV